MATCSGDGCTRPRRSLGWCATHYMRWRRTGVGTPTRMRIRPKCSLVDCEDPHVGLGYCQKHYSRFRKYGDANYVTRYFGDEARNFWAKVHIPADRAACWVWTGAINSGGYGSFGASGSSVEAHRWSYRNANGPLPLGKELDHICHTRDKTCLGGLSCLHRRCVNPAHLEPVVQRENWARGRAPSVANATKTRCKHGHEFTPENTYYRPDGARGCRKCIVRRVTAYKKRLGRTAQY